MKFPLVRELANEGFPVSLTGGARLCPPVLLRVAR